MATCFIALGTNLGERHHNLVQAQDRLPPQAVIENASSIYETPPWGFANQPDFLNQVLQCQTELPPKNLLAHLKAIEKAIGRTPSFRYGPRLIDLDLIAFDQLILESPALRIPHPRLHERRFVLEPLAEIAPDWVHPYFDTTASQLLAQLTQPAG